MPALERRGIGRVAIQNAGEVHPDPELRHALAPDRAVIMGHLHGVRTDATTDRERHTSRSPTRWDELGEISRSAVKSPTFHRIVVGRPE